MRAPSLLIVVSLAAVAGACSRSAPHPDAKLDRELDLALDRATQPAMVVSKLELEGESAAKPPARTPPGQAARSDARTPRRPAVHEHKLAGKPVPQPATAVAPEPAPEPAAEAPASTDGTASTAAPQATDPAPSDPDPTPAPAPTHTGRGGGWFPQPTDAGIPRTDGTDGIGIGLPGGGVIIIRGGGSGLDPCDRRGSHGGRPGGIGGVRIPGLPGGGIRIGGGGARRGPRIGGIGGLFRH